MPTTASCRLYLVTPLLRDAALAPRLAAACRAGDVAAVLARLEPADERSLVKRVKQLVEPVQATGAALLIGCDLGPDSPVDLAQVAVRGGADGVHAGVAELARLRAHLGPERILGAGSLRAKHDAMVAGEAGADYVMFGEPRADGALPPLAAVIERAAWWAEIFEPPCVAFAPTIADVADLAATGAEFVALGDAVWVHPEGPAAAVAAANRALSPERAL